MYWISDLLAAEAGFEKARILVYGYDSKVTKAYANVNQNNLFAHAKDLMYALAREKPPRRPVIFVAHSLGGLLVKEVLRRSEASEEDEFKVPSGFLRSLAFEEMRNRREDIKRPLDNTCQWLYSTAEYSTWIKRQDLPENHGLLWIKGKPGSGKSTLMKEALFHAKYQFSESQITTAGFFFNARGTQQLEKTPLGLYRSLLYQVLQQDMLAVHHLTPIYLEKKELHPDSRCQWTEHELQDILRRVFARPESRAAVLFIDAMDECYDDEVRDLVDFFKELAKKALSAGARLNVCCLSSRHYPHIYIQNCPELVVEDNNGMDILRYIEAKAEDNRPIADLKDDIFDKSSGVFLWVVLVIVILQKHGRGKSSKWLRQKLCEIPPELGRLFGTLFSQNDANDPYDAERTRSQTVCLMQLVLFAEEPMTLGQIHTAIAFGRNAHDSLQTWKDSVEYLAVGAQRKELVLDLSKGLLEDSYKSYSSDTEPTYQFIHETVREFFLSGEGFRLLGFSPDNRVREDSDETTP
ncbi:hypothetical protein F5X68DRAFT_239843 [Plectosphaerella plurivora]|uniref:Nephrocystin 3-like N-terminal domain-containing protein n=1 Tax=Plectosphaerella plurivora TaxID=936078 RepID=A0A9P8VDK8_9PEZI|nr:hypothetical protein F5X68DRAFT_239843 [Plectosphaerella plurivora]